MNRTPDKSLTCSRCLYWGTEDYTGHHNVAGHRTCRHPKLFDSNATEPDGACDAEAYGGIGTGPEFGCVHWQEKPS